MGGIKFKRHVRALFRVTEKNRLRYLLKLTNQNEYLVCKVDHLEVETLTGLLGWCQERLGTLFFSKSPGQYSPSVSVQKRCVNATVGLRRFRQLSVKAQHRPLARNPRSCCLSLLAVDSFLRSSSTPRRGRPL